MSNEANAAALLAILRPRVDPEELTGFYEGNFSPEGTKFLAYTFVPLADVDHDCGSSDLSNMPNFFHSFLKSML